MIHAKPGIKKPMSQCDVDRIYLLNQKLLIPVILFLYAFDISLRGSEIRRENQLSNEFGAKFQSMIEPITILEKSRIKSRT